MQGALAPESKHPVEAVTDEGENRAPNAQGA
jgi:hypothetical protein